MRRLFLAVSLLAAVDLTLIAAAPHPPCDNGQCVVSTPGVAAVKAATPVAIEAVKESGGSMVTTNTETPTQTETTTSVVTQPKTATDPAVVTATTTIVQVKTPKDMVGWAAGGLHNLPQLLAFFTILMGMMRAAADVLTEFSIFLYAVARLVKKPLLKRNIEVVAWGLAILGWAVSIFGVGSPRKFADHAFSDPPAPERPDLTAAAA